MAETTRIKKHFNTFTDRLALIINPKQAKPVKAKAPKRIARKNGVVVLKNFLDLPLDVVYEAFGYLDPSDLLTLSRLTKDFRAMFMSRTSISIWRRVLTEVQGLPPCPEDMTEPQYASLMFDKFCMACNSTRGSIITEYNTRLRLCATCTKTNICRGYTLQRVFNEIPLQIAASIIPHFAPQSGSFADSYAVNDIQRLARYYFKAELLRAFEGVSAQGDDGYTDNFLKEQQAVATRMVEEGAAMQTYHNKIRCEQEEKEEEMTERRYMRIKEEMEKLGWEKQYFPGWEFDEEDFERWGELMFQPKEFTARNWNSIRPKLTEIYNRCREQRKTTILRQLLSSAYIQHRSTLPPHERQKLPPWANVASLDLMKQFEKDNFEEGCSEDWVGVFVGVIVRVMVREGKWEGEVGHELAHMVVGIDRTQMLGCIEKEKESGKLVHGADGTASGSSAGAADSITITKGAAGTAALSAKAKGKRKAKESAPGTRPIDILARARNLFLCHCTTCAPENQIPGNPFYSFSGGVGGRVVSYPDLVNHVVDLAGVGKTWERVRPGTSLRLLAAAKDVVEALGLEEGVGREEVDRLGRDGEEGEDGKAEFVCGCGHYRYEGRLGFEMLVEHVYKQQFGYELIRKNVDETSKGLADELLINGHSRERLGDLIRVATKEDKDRTTQSALGPEDVDAEHVEAAGEDAEDEGQEAGRRGVGRGEQRVESDVRPGTFCRYCYQLELQGTPVRGEMMGYHVKYRHGREYEEGDFDTLDNLVEDYGEKDDEDDDYFPFPFNLPFLFFG